MNNFERFRLVVLNDLSLQERLRVADRDDFFAKVVELGAENGFIFSVDDINEVIRQNDRAWIERWI